MEVIAAAIRSSLVSFLSEKLIDVVDSETIQSYIDEWLSTGTTGNKSNKRRSQSKTVKKDVVKDIEISNSPSELLTREEYEKMKVTDLKNVCKERGLSCVGTKANLIDKILGETGGESAKTPVKKAAKTPVKKSAKVEADDGDDEQDIKPKCKSSLKKKSEKKSATADVHDDQSTDDEQPVQRKLKTKKRVEANLPKVIEKVSQVAIEIVSDQYGNDIHEDTGLVFNKENEVIGRVDEDGSVMRLTNQDVECCKRYNFSYIRESDFEDD